MSENNKKKVISESATHNPASNEITHTKRYNDGTTESKTTKINQLPSNTNNWLKGGGISATTSSTSEKIKRKQGNNEEKN